MVRTPPQIQREFSGLAVSPASIEEAAQRVNAAEEAQREKEREQEAQREKEREQAKQGKAKAGQTEASWPPGSLEARSRATFAAARRTTGVPGSSVDLTAAGQAKIDKSVREEEGRMSMVDAAAMKERVRKNLTKQKYDVSYYYKSKGIWQWIARNPHAESVTLIMVLINAMWIWVDTDFNNAEVLLNSEVIFQLAENAFCVYFSFEWLVRLLAFRYKRDGLRDQWFVFDGVLVIMMGLETWVFSMFIVLFAQSSTNGIGHAKLMSVARMMRLFRMCRMARVLRYMPELMIMIKGLLAAARSVFFTLVLLGGLVFIFAIAFTQMAAETPLHDAYFRTVPSSMYFLMLHGALLLSTEHKATEINEQGGFFLTLMLFAFVLIGAVLLMNMLIGVLCEVVSAVAATEREELLVNYVRVKLDKVMAIIDEDGGGTISRDEFMLILENQEAMEALQDVGVDVVGLVDFADFIFGDEGACDDEETPEVELTMPEFMEVILQLRGSNNATVKDIVDLRKFIRNAVWSNVNQIDGAHERVDALNDVVDNMLESLQRDRAARRSSVKKDTMPLRCSDNDARSHASSSTTSEVSKEPLLRAMWTTNSKEAPRMEFITSAAADAALNITPCAPLSSVVQQPPPPPPSAVPLLPLPSAPAAWTTRATYGASSTSPLVTTASAVSSVDALDASSITIALSESGQKQSLTSAKSARLLEPGGAGVNKAIQQPLANKQNGDQVAVSEAFLPSTPAGLAGVSGPTPGDGVQSQSGKSGKPHVAFFDGAWHSIGPSQLWSLGPETVANFEQSRFFLTAPNPGGPNDGPPLVPQTVAGLVAQRAPGASSPPQTS
eukprot:TRINITY_DN13207_c0_g1_i1.p1 TRINITY_DN13207_c0_g1~~TRINITY_DN13207_c0_g1_i1.p1  ORF type:complete len:836 (+),score=192.94 TRINITY_DN13207_c0_g1_i1:151-2658(+)